MRPMLFLTFVLVLLAAVLAVVEPSLAQWNNPVPAPAPLIGMIGLPVAGLVLAAVWLARRMGRD